MRLLMPPYRRWAAAAEAGFVMLLMVGLAVSDFSERHGAVGWFGLSMALLVLIIGVRRWRRGGRRT